MAGSKKGNREHNFRKDKRRRMPTQGFDDGGGWKKPKAPKRNRRNEDVDAIQNSIDLWDE